MKKVLFSELKLKMITLLLLQTAGILAGSAAAFFLAGNLLAEKSQDNSIGVRGGGYNFISPLIMCSADDNPAAAKEPGRLKSDVKKTVEMITSGRQADSLAVYFREYKTGKWFVIGGDEKFHPASIMKVTTLAAVLKDAEADPSLMKMKIKDNLEQDQASVQDPKPSVALEKGKEYTVEELLYRMIVYSDNNAGALLEGVPSVKTLQNTYNELMVPNPYLPKAEDYASVKDVSHIFRVLYDSTFLDRERSEKALMTLSRTDFKGGIRGGTPEDIVVAHKFGDWKYGENKEKRQLHDCGIVYYPGSPYLLCIMSKGKSFEELDAAIEKISAVVFNGIKAGKT